MKILHVSDLHLKAQGDFGQELVIERMLEDVKRAADDAPFDAAVISGDLAATGQPVEFDRVQELLIQPLLEALALPVSKVVIVPGNHDIDRNLIGAFLEPGLKASLDSTEQVDALAQNPTEFDAALRRLDAWGNLESRLYGSEPLLVTNRLARTHLPEIWGGSLGVVALNSAWRATGAPNDADRGTLIISESHAVNALEAIQSADTRIVVMHHPLNWLTDWSHSALRLELERRGCVVLSGHEHVADPTWSRTGRGAALYLPTACLYQGNRRLPIAYSIVSPDAHERSVSVQIRSWKESRGTFDKATEYLPDGEEHFDLPDAQEASLAPTPRYTIVASSLVDAAVNHNSFSELMDESQPARLFDIVVEPRFFPAPFTQVAATAALAQSQNKPMSRLASVPIARQLDKVQVAIVTGDPLAGVSNALLWLLGDIYERSGTLNPIYFKYERLPGRDPIDRQIRSAAPLFGITAGPQDPLPPLAVAIDDIDTGDPLALTRLISHIQGHPENKYILGCHEHHGTALAAALDEVGIEFQHGYLGPFGLVQLRQLIQRVGGDSVAPHVGSIMRLVFGERLPRSPFVLAAVIAVLSANPSSRPPNESRVLEAVISLLLGKFDPSDTEAGIDARGREALLQDLARKFTIEGIERIDRRSAETFVATYFDERGFEGSESPGRHLSALISRRILTEDNRGVGFRHRPFQDVMAATFMRVNPEFASVMLSDPPRYASVIRHAAWLGRNDRGLLNRVGESTRPSIEAAIARNISVFDQLLGRGFANADDDDIERLIELAAPPSNEQQEQSLEQHYEFREVTEAADLSIDILEVTKDALGATGFLSTVLAGSELVDDVPLKADLLKEALRGWNAIAEELGQQGHEWIAIRPLFDEIFGDVPPDARSVLWQFFMRTSLVVSTALAVTGTLAVRGLGAAMRSLSEDPDIIGSASLDFMLTLLYAELELDGWVERLKDMHQRHRGHLMVSDLSRMLAMSKFLSPQTRLSDVAELEKFLLDVVASSAGGPDAVQRRSSERSRMQTRLRDERSRHRDDAYGSGIVDGILALDEPDAS